MRYKKIIAVCMLSMFLATSGAYAEPAATNSNASVPEYTVVEGMSFTGAVKSLSLEDALKQMTTESPAAKVAELNKDSAMNSTKSNAEKVRSINSAIKSMRELKLSSQSSNVFDAGVTEDDVELLKTHTEFINAQYEANYQAEMNAITSDTVSQYFKTLQAEDAIRIHKENIATQKKILSNAQKKFELGVVAKTEVMEAETALIKAESDLLTAENQYKAARMNLNVTLGYDVMQDVKLTTKLEKLPNKITPIAEGVKSALEKRNEVNGTKYSIKLEEMKLANLQYRYPKNSATYKAQEIAVVEAKDQYEQTRKGIELDVRYKYITIDEKAKAITSAQATLEKVKETSRIAQLAYDLGNSTMTDVQQAQLAVFNTEITISMAILDYNLAVYDYEFAIGHGVKAISI